MKTEYRISWQREGRRRKYVRRATVPAVTKHLERLASFDLHYACDHESQLCDPLPPIVGDVRVDTRQVTDWVRGGDRSRA